jgi:hypothetical protein
VSSPSRGAEGVVGKRVSFREGSFEAPATWTEDATVTFAAPGPAPRTTLSFKRLEGADAEASSLTMLVVKRVAAFASVLAALEVKASGDVRIPFPGGRATEARLTFDELEGPMVLRLMAVELGSRRFMLVGRALALHDAQLNAAFDLVATSLSGSSLGDAMRASLPQPPGPGAPLRVEHAGVTFSAPPGWEEESTVVLVSPGRQPKPSLTLTRLGVAPDMKLDMVVARFVAQLAVALPARVLESSPTRAAGLRGTELLLGYEGGGVGAKADGPAVQKLVFLEARDAVWVVAGAATLQGAKSMNEELVHALSTLRLPNPESR